ncbi:MAG: DUF5050 domain-containing protein [Clostridia bacterium]|nr:DUF5050 domain-containing protein [Clostridia bacterium]
MKITRLTIFIFFTVVFLCTVCFAGNIINEGLFVESDGVLYYSEQDDSGKLYANKDGYKIKLSDLNAKYINIYNNDIYFCSTDDTGEFAAISKYSISSNKVFTLYAVEMVKGLKNLYVQSDTAYFQSDGEIFSFSLSSREIKSVIKDGEISGFIPTNDGFVYSRIDTDATPLFYFSGNKSERIHDNVVAFDVDGDTVYYTDKNDNTINSRSLSTGKVKMLHDIYLTNLIYDNGTIYGKGDNDYIVYEYNVANDTITSGAYDIYSVFNIIDGKVKGVYYSGALLSQTIFDSYSPAVLTSYLPDGEYKNWKQYDSRWANIKFPNGETIKQVGCLVTSIAILVVGSGIRDEVEFNPGTFVESLKNNNGFSGASLYWSAVERVIPEFKLYSSWTSLNGTKKEKAQLISSHLEQGRKVVVRAVSNQHWVAVDKVENGKIYICDPGRNVTDLFDYYDANDVTRIAIFHPVSSETVKYESGLYSITSDNGLRLRAGPGLNYDRLSLIPFEEVVEIKSVGDQWGYTTYNGVNGWVFMEYTKFIQPLMYTVKYNANGGINAPESQQKTHDSPLGLTLSQPQYDGYIFLGWSPDPSASFAAYFPGDVYQMNDNITLYAVWQKSSSPFIYGDTNLDGIFSLADIAITALHIKNPDEHPLTYEMFSAADINKDNVVNIIDLELMKIKLASI